MGVRKDLPNRFHRLESGDLGRGKRVTFFDVSRTDRANRRRLEMNQPGRDRAAAHVRLPPDVDHLRHRDLRDTIREGEKERRNMIRRKTAVAVLIAVIVGAAFAAYTFRPKATTSSVAVNEPGTDTGNPGTGTTPSTPPTSPAKASQGPKHDKCVHENDHIPDQARVHGANWYRFYDRAACTALQSLEDFVSIF